MIVFGKPLNVYRDSMYIKDIQDQKTWDTFVSQNGPRSGRFLQMWDWGAFQQSVGRKVMRVGFVEEEELVAVAQCILFSLPVGKRYLYCPRGPILESEFVQPASDLDEGFELLKKRERVAFIRFEPSFEPSVFLRPKPVHATIHLHPTHTLLLNLSPSQEELFANFHQKTRYNIRLAQRHGVQIHCSSDPKALVSVWPLFEQTAKRGKFQLHEQAYYAHMLETLSKEKNVHAFLTIASYQDQPVAATMSIDCAGTRTYLHGASSDSFRHIMAPYLLHWQLIEAARAHAMDWYDWWGIMPEDATPDHEWSGITRFKKGFGGELVIYPGTYDYVFNPFGYKIYKMLREWRRRGK